MCVTTRQIAPGMIQQMQHVCYECQGSGEVITELDRCPQCNGNKITQEKKVLNVNVEKGMLHGQKIVFNAEADEAVKSFFAMQISSAFSRYHHRQCYFCITTEESLKVQAQL